MISKKASRSIMKLLNHKSRYDNCLNDIINKNYSLKTTNDVGLWWLLGY